MMFSVSAAPKSTRSVVACVLAGGRGVRMKSLTAGRAKPAVPFGGEYRIIDFTLSNCVNSGIHRIGVLTQYESRELINHVQRCWPTFPGRMAGSVEIWPAQQDSDDNWYRGTADAVRQNLGVLRGRDTSEVLVLAGDHIYSMDYRDMLEMHRNNDADVTIACSEVPIADATRCGVMQVDAAGRVTEFTEKPAHPKGSTERPDSAVISMGIYVFNIDALREALAANGGSLHDFGGDVLPWMIGSKRVQAFHFSHYDGRPRFWRDAGTVDAYFEASMALLDPIVRRDLYREDWPIVTEVLPMPPAIIECDEQQRAATVQNSILGQGSRVQGARVSGSIVSTGVQVGSGSTIERSVLLPGVVVGSGCFIRNAIVQEDCQVPDGTIIDPVHRAADAGQSIELVTHASLAASKARTANLHPGNRTGFSTASRAGENFHVDSAARTGSKSC